LRRDATSVEGFKKRSRRRRRSRRRLELEGEMPETETRDAASQTIGRSRRKVCDRRRRRKKI